MASLRKRTRTLSDDIKYMTPTAALGSTPVGAGSPPEACKRGRGNFTERAFAPLTAGGVRQSIFTLVQTAVGGGVLTISYMMRSSGMFVALGLLSIAGLVALLSMTILMRSAVELKIYSFSGLLAACIGSKSAVLLDISLFLYGNGALITYFIFLGDFIPSIVTDLFGTIMAPDALRTLCLQLCFCVTVPMAFPQELSALRYVAPIALIGLVYTATVVAVKCPELYASRVGEDGYGDVDFGHFGKNIFQSYAIGVFAYNCHLNVVPVVGELQDPSEARIVKVNFRVVAVQWVFYVLIAIGGYLSFLAATPQNLLKGYGTSDGLILVSRLMLSTTIIAAIPTNANPTVRSLMTLLEVPFPSLRVGAGDGTPPAQQPLLASEAASGATAAAAAGAEAVTVPRQYPLNREGLRHLLTTCCLAVVVLVAMYVREVAVVVGILGATVGTLMMMVMPTLLILIGCPTLLSPARKWATTIFFSLSACMSLASLFVH
eukprot:TRINITY_DN47368_c0_g1_i1.p1 TRINITY_DN47368_c0_g1~~TRINITY_DN47368_c0_g1_i1.p1  ORF type:complete len:489 (-),score=112.05 TRINITY_DN47368_c0_g1_i1:94-1560(-)